MQFVNTLNPKVLSALRIKSVAIAKIAAVNPVQATGILAEMEISEFEGRELYDIGLELLKTGATAANNFSSLHPEIQLALSQAQAETIMRQQGVSGLVEWIGNLESASQKKFTANGNLSSEVSGTTSFALDRLADFLGETSTVDEDQLFAKLLNAKFIENPLESTSAFKILAKINPQKALETAQNLKGPNAFPAERGAFIEVSKSDSDIALKYLSTIYDTNKQNILLSLLFEHSSDPQIKNECESILEERNIEPPFTK